MTAEHKLPGNLKISDGVRTYTFVGTRWRVHRSIPGSWSALQVYGYMPPRRGNCIVEQITCFKSWAEAIAYAVSEAMKAKDRMACDAGIMREAALNAEVFIVT